MTDGAHFLSKKNVKRTSSYSLPNPICTLLNLIM